MISIVVPAYNEEAGLPELYRRITEAARNWNETYELILVDDGSRDRTLAIAEEIAATDRNLKIISFSRNFGHQAAVSAGLLHATGDIVSVMDADLQDPPEELLPFIEKVREGFDVVYAVRTKRKEGPFKRLAYFVYYRLLKRLATLDIPLDAGDFCVMRGEVVQAMNALPERNRFVRGLRTWVGFHQTGISYERAARFAGEPKYTLTKLIRLGLDGIVNFSYRPLQVITVVGLLFATAAILLAVLVTVLYVTNRGLFGFNPRAAQGWTSLTLMILTSTAIQLISLGILGEYVGRLFEEVKRRPQFVVRRRVNIEKPETGEAAAG